MGSDNLLNASAQLTAERMLDSLLIGAALAVFAWVLLRALPRPNSSTRFAAWFTALLATAFLPLVHRPQEFFGNVTPAQRPLISVPGAWALYLFVAWVVITAISLLRVGIGFLELRRLRRGCRTIVKPDPGWQATVARLCPTRRVEILTSDDIHVPTAIGFMRPAIVIPAGLLAQLSIASASADVINPRAEVAFQLLAIQLFTDSPLPGFHTTNCLVYLATKKSPGCTALVKLISGVLRAPSARARCATRRNARQSAFVRKPDRPQ
jgi:hypothetical protein